MSYSMANVACNNNQRRPSCANHHLNTIFCAKMFDSQLNLGALGAGKVVQRFPDKDWPDAPFIEGIELVSRSLH